MRLTYHCAYNRTGEKYTVKLLLNLLNYPFYLKIKLYLQSVAKYLAKVKENKQNWAIPEKFDICFCISFDRYC